ncbi:CHASE4 domain-containing protein [Pelotomaculum propionicicum]|uniref:CHASE4 domain-containing protein n=1 Tax=Pelotomaculum propionicicum TaxID=258475 RepID=UPI003B799995
MKLRTKMVLIAGLTFFSLIAILFAASRFIITSSFARLEEQNTRINIQRVLDYLAEEQFSLSRTATDWSAWDDTYDFIEDVNNEYIERNLLDESISAIKINYIVYINSTGQVVFSKGIDINNDNEPLAVPNSLLEHFHINDPILKHSDPTSGIAGVILLPEGPMLIASRPIVTSNFGGPVRGTLIMGRYLDANEISYLSGQTHLSVTVHQLNDPEVPPDMSLAMDNLSEEITEYVRPLDKETIAGYAMINDIYGDPALLLRIDWPRDVYKQGETSVAYFVFSLVLAGTICLYVILLLLRKMVLSRLEMISDSVIAIGDRSDLSARLQVTGKDELSGLAAAINGMLANLEQTQQKLEQDEVRFRALAENAQDVIYRYRYLPSPGFEYISPSVISISGYTPEEFYADPQITNKISHPDDYPDRVSFFKNPPRDNAPHIMRWVHKNGMVFWAEHREVAFYDEDNNLLAIEGIVRDVTARRQAEEQLRHLSLHDPLTGLYNRAYFEQEMRRAEVGRKYPVCIVVCDVDGLKLVNDTLGHEKGDSLLVAAAGVIKSSFRESDMVARIGGDEFAVLFSEGGEDTVKQACGRIGKAIENYNSTNPELPLSISVGFAVKTDPDTSMNEIFKVADNNMYREKLHCSQSGRSAIVQTLKKALEARDFITEGHAERLQDLVTGLARAISMPESKITELRLLAQFHDIGKVGIPDSILFKRGPLTSEEAREMQRHSEIGHRIAMSAPDLAPIAEFILKHHEWWNGTGYPLKLKGQNIPLECRILAIADAYDAMTSDRPYRKAMPHEDAIAEINRCKGVQFDPELVPVFIKLLGKNVWVWF